MSTSQIKKGVDQAFGFWLSQRPISTETDIEVGVKQAFSQWLSERMGAVEVEDAIKHAVSAWLDLHGAEILERLEKKLTK
jgi:hypothetical protein